MQFNKRDMIEKLKLEISVIRDGGYNPSVHRPHDELRPFRDSVTCLNFGLEEKRQPCEECFLIRFVPAEHRDKQEPCHYIPLNARGDTAASLVAAGDRERMDTALLGWLSSTLARLQQEVSKEAKSER